MKRYILYIVTALAAFVSCEDEISIMDRERQLMDERTSLVRDLDVSYSIGGGTSRTSFGFNSRHRVVELDVLVNDPNLRWNIESDRSWCKVASGSHKGPGSVSLEIEANEDFEDREQATLTFVAGAFRGFKFKVEQQGSVFIVSLPYTVAGKESSSASVLVSVQKNEGEVPDWTIETPAWISAGKGSQISDDEFQQTVRVDYTLEANADDSRYGQIRFCLEDSDETGVVDVFQFGTDYEWEGDSCVFFPKGDASISLLAPEFIVSGAKYPEYVSFTQTPSGMDGVVRVTFDLKENYSDCDELRKTAILLTLTNLSRSEVSLPSIVQDYVPAGGLVTSRGMELFAEAVAKGASLENWQTDGVVTLKGDIDMTGVQSWAGIGTVECPFSGTFDGCGHSVQNLKQAASGLFNRCKDATVKNVGLDSKSGIYMDGATVCGGIVNYAANTVVQNCRMDGNIEAGAFDDEGLNAYGGIVGYADTLSVLSGDRFLGRLTISTPAGEYEVDCGGIAGFCEGSLDNAESNGSIVLNTTAQTVNVGGILGRVPSAAKVSSNIFSGEIKIGGGVQNLSAGGLYGKMETANRVFDFSTDKSVMAGSVTVNSYASSTETKVFAGGLAGLQEPGCSLAVKGYEVITTFKVYQTTALYSKFLCTGGIIGGTVPDGLMKNVLFENVTNRGRHTVENDKNVASCGLNFCMAGLAGYVRGPLTVIGCVNEASLGHSETDAYTARSNSYKMVVAGIVGMAEGGDASLSGCANSGTLHNLHYCNSTYENYKSGRVECNVTAGIVGGFEYLENPGSHSITIENCRNTGPVQAFRGFCNGIVGSAVNAGISNCTCTGSLDGSTISGTSQANNSSYKSGIAGMLSGSSTISNCTVQTNICANSAGSELASAAGILSIDLKGTALSGCSFYGTIPAFATAKEGAFAGGIVAVGCQETGVSGCRFGGTILGTSVTENNCPNLAIGNGLGVAQDITYWDGK